MSGAHFEIFQDVDDIDVGERWSETLDQMLVSARFFIPILTPSYFQSKACRDELQKFLKAEERAGRRDLILPIYYIQCAILEEEEQRRADHLASTIHGRQRWDWRDLRHHSLRNRKVRLQIEALAQAIGRARRIRGEQPRAPTPAALSPVNAPKLRDSEAGSVATAAMEPMPNLTGAAVSRKVAPTPPAAPSSHADFREQALPRAIDRARPSGLLQTSDAPAALGRVFRDIEAPWWPEMVEVPPDEFMMGSADGDIEAHDEEKPQHPVQIAYRLAVGRYPVTFEEFDHFASAKKRVPPHDRTWGRERRPVINVSWDDAQAFVEWLAQETGKPYRLLSEAEWEYACRAGTTTRYWWGDGITPENANYGVNAGRTTEVGAYPANPWELYDMHGNVWEWVEDRWHGSYEEDRWHRNYEGAPNDGAARRGLGGKAHAPPRRLPKLV